MDELDLVEGQARSHIEGLAAKGLSARWDELSESQRAHHLLIETGARRIVQNWHGSVPVIQDCLDALMSDPQGNRREIAAFMRALQICSPQAGAE